MRTYQGLITKLGPDQIFVFGSNIHGRHGAGTAKIAFEKHGAIMGMGFGRQGKCYAIATTDLSVKSRPSVPTKYVVAQIQGLYNYAIHNPHLEFLVAYTTRGPFLSGFTLNHLVAMFSAIVPIPVNIVFEEEFAVLIQERVKINNPNLYDHE